MPNPFGDRSRGQGPINGKGWVIVANPAGGARLVEGRCQILYLCVIAECLKTMRETHGDVELAAIFRGQLKA